MIARTRRAGKEDGFARESADYADDCPVFKLAFPRMQMKDMPYMAHLHHCFSDFSHPGVIGARRNIFARDFCKYVDVNPAVRA